MKASIQSSDVLGTGMDTDQFISEVVTRIRRIDREAYGLGRTVNWSESKVLCGDEVIVEQTFARTEERTYPTLEIVAVLNDREDTK